MEHEDLEDVRTYYKVKSKKSIPIEQYLKQRKYQLLSFSKINIELAKSHLNISNIGLLNDLKKVAKAIDKKYVTRHEYDKNSVLNHHIFIKRFGSWKESLKKAGLPVVNTRIVSEDELLYDIRKVAAELRKSSVTTQEYKKKVNILHLQY